MCLLEPYKVVAYYPQYTNIWKQNRKQNTFNSQVTKKRIRFLVKRQKLRKLTHKSLHETRKETVPLLYSASRQKQHRKWMRKVNPVIVITTHTISTVTSFLCLLSLPTPYPRPDCLIKPQPVQTVNREIEWRTKALHFFFSQKMRTNTTKNPGSKTSHKNFAFYCVRKSIWEG